MRIIDGEAVSRKSSAAAHGGGAHAPVRECAVLSSYRSTHVIHVTDDHDDQFRLSARSFQKDSTMRSATSSPTDRPLKAASRTRRAAASGGNGRSTTFSRPRWWMTRRNEVSDREPLVGSGVEPPLVWSSIGGDATTATGRGRGGGAMKLGDRGRRRLIPSREQVTWSDPTVTSMISAISSRVFPPSTRFLICSIRSGVNLSRRPDFDGNSTNLIFSLIAA